MRAISTYDLFARFPDEDACLDQIFRSKWGDGQVCPACGHSGQWTRIRGTRKFLHSCRKHISPTAQTPFFRCNIPLQTIFYAILLFCNSSTGVRGPFLRKHLGLGTAASHRLANLIRLHMASQQRPQMIGGSGDRVAVDEVYLKHFTGLSKGLVGRIAMGIECSGTVQCGFISNRSTKTLEAAVTRFVGAGCVVMTDQWTGYRRLNALGFDHRSVNHKRGEFWRDTNTTATIDTVWASFRPAFRLYRNVSFENSWLYLAEAQFRYNYRHDHAAAFETLVSSWPPVCRYDPSVQRAYFEWDV